MTGTQLTLLRGGSGATRYRPPRTPAPPGPVWTAYTAARRPKCVDCLLECARDSSRPAARLARRRLRHGALDLLVCNQHAADRGDTVLRRRQRAAG